MWGHAKARICAICAAHVGKQSARSDAQNREQSRTGRPYRGVQGSGDTVCARRAHRVRRVDALCGGDDANLERSRAAHSGPAWNDRRFRTLQNTSVAWRRAREHASARATRVRAPVCRNRCATRSPRTHHVESAQVARRLQAQRAARWCRRSAVGTGSAALLRAGLRVRLAARLQFGPARLQVRRHHEQCVQSMDAGTRPRTGCRARERASMPLTNSRWERNGRERAQIAAKKAF